MKKHILGLTLMAFALNLQAQTTVYRATLDIQDQKLPFSMTLYHTEKGKEQLIIRNAEESIILDELKRDGDSIFARFPIFDSELRIKQIRPDSLQGQWHNYSKGKKHTLIANTNRMSSQENSEKANKYAGKWEVDFSSGTADSSKASAIIENRGTYMAGTFLTPTGDYRYLQGDIENETLWLSCFDGSHAFLFKARIQSDGTLKGMFWSGATWNEPWLAKRNEAYELPDPEKLTFLKPGYDKLSFSFPDLNKKQVSLSDERFKGKVVIVQLMGSWCPNCMDESAFLSDFYKKNKDKGLEIVGLAYERTKDIDKSIANVNRLKQRFGIEYPLLIAGSSDKAEAVKTLPMLNHIMSFPTTIIIDKSGKVVKIHTGYSGPATGKYYDKFVDDFTNYIISLTK